MVRPGLHWMQNCGCTSVPFVYFNQLAAYMTASLGARRTEFLFKINQGYARNLKFYARCGPGVSYKSLILIVSNKTEYQIINFLQQSSEVIC